MIWNYQPYLILALDPPQSSCGSHDMGNAGPVDRMGYQSAAGTSPRDMNERVQRVRLPQSLSELRLDKIQDNG